jgi:hypothetical protein
MSTAPPVRPPNAPYALAFMAAELLALPGIGLGLYAWAVGRVASSGGWLVALFELFFSGIVVLPIVLLCLVALFVAGAFAAVRPWAALALLVINGVALATAYWVMSPKTAAELVVWLPTLLSMGVAGWLARRGFAT